MRCSPISNEPILTLSISYLVLTAGFYWAPNTEAEDTIDFGPLKATFQSLGQFFITS